MNIRGYQMASKNKKTDKDKNDDMGQTKHRNYDILILVS